MANFLNSGIGIVFGCSVLRLICVIFFSSVFYVIDFLKHPGRDVLWWNPLLHGVVWFRTAIYPDYPANILSKPYMLTFCALSILIGLALERVARRRA